MNNFLTIHYKWWTGQENEKNLAFINIKHFLSI